MGNRFRLLTMSIMLALVLLSVSAAQPGLSILAAPATAITVDTTIDDTVVNGNCTLREAIIAANTDSAIDGCPAGSGADTIHVPAGTYKLAIAGAGEDQAAQGDLDITASLTIAGAGAGQTVIDGNALDRVIHVVHGLWSDPVDLTLTNLAVRGGKVSGNGGGIASEGYLAGNTISLTKTIIVNNSASQEGGGLWNDMGKLSMVASKVLTNTAQGNGGGVSNQIGELSIIDSTISGNNSGGSGGGVFSPSGSDQVITDSDISGNSAANMGGGLSLSMGNATLGNTTIRNNTSTDGGGGIAATGNIVVIYNSTIAENKSSTWGGGISAAGTQLAVANSTLSGNTADSSGGGLSLSLGGTHLHNVTISKNVADHDGDGSGDGGGINATGLGPVVTIQNSIIAANSDRSPSFQRHDCYLIPFGPVSNGYNLIGNSEGCNWTPASGDLIGDSSRPIDPCLNPLADNGGTTSTHGLQMGSRAINGGNPAGCTDHMGNPLDIDQRGFPRVQGCDIGSFEFQVPLTELFLPMLTRD